MHRNGNSHNAGGNAKGKFLFGKQFPLLIKDYILEAVLGSQTVSFKVKHSYHMI